MEKHTWAILQYKSQSGQQVHGGTKNEVCAK
jgi:hypothetical protein